MYTCIAFSISECQRKQLGFRCGPNGYKFNLKQPKRCHTYSPTVEPMWSTSQLCVSNCFHYNQTSLILRGSMSWKYFLEIETKEMLRKDSKVVVAQGEGAICCFLQSIMPCEGLSASWKDRSSCPGIPVKASKSQIFIQICWVKPCHECLGSCCTRTVF